MKLKTTEVVRWGCSHTEPDTWIGVVDITRSSIQQCPVNVPDISKRGNELEGRKHQSAARVIIRRTNGYGLKIRRGATGMFEIKINQHRRIGLRRKRSREQENAGED